MIKKSEEINIYYLKYSHLNYSLVPTKIQLECKIHSYCTTYSTCNCTT